MRILSGIPGLDDLLEGGFPEGTANLVCGPAGSAKSLMGMQFLCIGEPGMLITLEESRESVLRASRGYGLPLEDLERQGVVTILDIGSVRADGRVSGDAEEVERDFADFGALLEAAKRMKETHKAKRLVIDSLSAITLYYQTPEQYRRGLFRFCRGLKALGLTALLIAETSPTGQTAMGVENFVADSMLMLGYENVKGEYRRTLTVYKMRFTRHDPYKHPFLITPNGMEVDPDEVIF